MREVELLVRGVQLEKKLENHVQNLVGAGVFAVDLVDDDDRLEPVLHRLAKDEFGLRLRAVVGIDDEEDAVDHLHDPLDLAAEVGVARGIHDVDVVAVPVDGGVFRQNGNTALFLLVVGVHYAFVVKLVALQGAGLTQEFVYQGGFTVVNVSNDGDVT